MKIRINISLLLGSLFSLSAILVPTTSQAQNCSLPPSCASLGFTKTAVQCNGIPATRCPFDNTAYYCLTCEDLGYRQTKNECNAILDAIKTLCVTATSSGTSTTPSTPTPPPPTAQDCFKPNTYMLPCPFDKNKFNCKKCTPIGLEKFYVLVYSADPSDTSRNGTFGRESFNCEEDVYDTGAKVYNMQCGSGLIFQKSCNCCDFPK